MLQTVTFIFNQFLHITFSHTFVVSFVQDTPWFCGLILIHLFYIKLLVYSFWRFETNLYNKQDSIKDTSFSFLYYFMTVYITICKYYLSTLHILMSVWIFSIHFLRYWQGICSTFKASLVGDHFLYSHDLNMWFRGDIVRRN